VNDQSEPAGVDEVDTVDSGSTPDGRGCPDSGPASESEVGHGARTATPPTGTSGATDGGESASRDVGRGRSDADAGTSAGRRADGDATDDADTGDGSRDGDAAAGETVTARQPSTLGERANYLLTLSRPRFWFYLAGPVIVGVTFAAETVGELFSPLAIGLFVYFLLPANVLLYGVNDVFDADLDAENPKKDREEGAREARFSGDRWVIGVVVACGAVGLALFPTLPSGAWPWLVAFFLLAVEYSAPPFRFKTTPFLDSVSNGLYVLPGIIAYVAVAGAQPPPGAIVGGWLWAMGMHTFSAIPDIDPDRAAGIRTTATVLGEERTYAYCGAAWLSAAVAFAVVDNRLGALLLAYPIVVFAIYWSDVDVSEAYWWYPAINTLVGMVMTIGALTRIVPPTRILEALRV
jgi:4-hydroxybenzoate polyprenyltransferase